MFTEVNKKMLQMSKSIEIDVKDDEEQSAKIKEIIEMLISAGYYRARIQGLGNFDKVIGGMTWCIESCYYDVDVDILFQENLTIGQKIALTEKIVVVLPKMNCPYRIEPHQIQGLDSAHIFPVVEWLVKESMRTKETMASYLRSFALYQFNNKYISKKDVLKLQNIDYNLLLANIATCKKSYETRQCFKQHSEYLTDEFSIISNTLLEYGDILQIPQRVINTLQEKKMNNSSIDKENSKNVIEQKVLEKTKVEELTKNLQLSDDNEIQVSHNIAEKILSMQVQEATKALQHYSSLPSFKCKNEQFSSQRLITVMEKQKSILKSNKELLLKKKETLNDNIINIENQLKQSEDKKQSIKNAYKIINNKEFHNNQRLLRQLEKLLILHDELKDHEYKFREQCRYSLNIYKKRLEQITEDQIHEKEDKVIKYGEHKEIVQKLKLQLAKKNRIIATLIRQLDDVPGRSELTQYQRRFMELYNQVSTKHKETKQYYTLYNTLDDTKLYLSKELSLLNSIQDSYNEALTSSSRKEQIIKQFEIIVDGVEKTKQKVEKRCLEEKSRRDVISNRLTILMEQQRKYIVAVRQLTIECRKNEILLTRLRGS